MKGVREGDCIAESETFSQVGIREFDLGGGTLKYGVDGAEAR